MALSMRLRRALLALYRQREEPDARAHVLTEGFHRRAWARILKRSKLAGVRFKDLRDTYGSQLVSAGVPLPYVSRQLGHASIEVTSKHYARWCGGDEYREPVRLLPSELPADLLARPALAGDPSLTAVGETAEGPFPKPPADRGVVEHETGLEPATPTLATWRSTN